MKTNEAVNRNKKFSAAVLIRASLLCALIFVITCYLMIRVPGVGYIHLGDFAVMLAAAVLPQPYALLAAAIGASIADVVAGYVVYLPITFLTKLAMTLIFSSKSKKLLSVRNLIAMLSAILINPLGYYIGEAVMYKSFVSPLTSVPFNLLQSFLGAVLFVLVCAFLDSKPKIAKIIRGKYDN